VGNGTVYAASEKDEGEPGLEPTHNRPIKKFRCGPVVAAIWEKEIMIKDRNDGKMKSIKLQSVSFQRRYRDKKTGEWRNSTTYPTDNLSDLVVLAQRCVEWIKLKDDDAPRDLESADNSNY